MKNKAGYETYFHIADNCIQNLQIMQWMPAGGIVNWKNF